MSDVRGERRVVRGVRGGVGAHPGPPLPVQVGKHLQAPPAQVPPSEQSRLVLQPEIAPTTVELTATVAAVSGATKTTTDARVPSMTIFLRGRFSINTGNQISDSANQFSSKTALLFLLSVKTTVLCTVCPLLISFRIRRQAPILRQPLKQP